MKEKKSRNFSFKDIEFIVVCGFTLLSFLRDILLFRKYSPKFTDEFGTALQAEIDAAKELVEPQSEMVEQKAITDRMHTTILALPQALNWIKGYIEMAGKSIGISVKDFGINETKDAIKKMDIEGVIKGLHTVNTNIVKFKPILTVQGLSEELATRLAGDATSISNDRQRQYEILTNRKAILQDNVETLNVLHAKIMEIHKVGKILFKGNDPVKLQEYTMTELLKKVRRVSKPTEEPITPPVA